LSTNTRFAVHKGDSASLAQLNDALAAVQRSGKFDEIYAKWHRPDRTPPPAVGRSPTYILPAVLVVLIITLIIAWQRRMLAPAGGSGRSAPRN